MRQKLSDSDSNSCHIPKGTNLALSIMLEHERDVLDVFTDEALVVAIQRQTDGRVCQVFSVNPTAQ